ncbi:hypothetical protein CAOG_09184 [Capsaspora owczarzaki ATCC 30864]|uniref:WEE/WEE1 protein kinase n=1 Tax=Capsaspora owczarzaki (strain ATCC 30864) TaxID=595528 RepID=A0A0D2UTB5_CAPO3|nr:hypothetical protein CAOG_09184 [Capsaspora owczarzaki ATCC 30864]KJE98221.1 WEE/WEE1 protein kinase [Capsaspora owczarzaki ATCC 30864]|eukprot:XP_011270901.1 hypothetical protein CAOG_09184 [Capsaspora owczarzaki ATCC 30864]
MRSTNLFAFQDLSPPGGQLFRHKRGIADLDDPADDSAPLHSETLKRPRMLPHSSTPSSPTATQPLPDITVSMDSDEPVVVNGLPSPISPFIPPSPMPTRQLRSSIHPDGGFVLAEPLTDSTVDRQSFRNQSWLARPSGEALALLAASGSSTLAIGASPRVPTFATQSRFPHLRQNSVEPGASRSRLQDDFSQKELIGSGEFGTVYRCVNNFDGMPYAIKKLNHNIRSVADSRSHQKEVWAHSIMGTNRHVVRYYGAWPENNSIYIQNEYCDQGNLENVEHEFSEPELRDMLRQLVSGLRHMHQHGLAHLDIKPANIFLSNESVIDEEWAFKEDVPFLGRSGNRSRSSSSSHGYNNNNNNINNLTSNSSNNNGTQTNPYNRPIISLRRASTTIRERTVYKLGDLGHVASIQSPDGSDVEEGDRCYMAKELLHEPVDVSQLQKGDIFSLGIVLYELGTGTKPPPNGDDWQALRTGKVPEIPRFSKTMNDLMRHMLHPDPRQRPSCTDLVKQLDLALPGKSTSLAVSLKQTRTQLELELEQERNKVSQGLLELEQERNKVSELKRQLDDAQLQLERDHEQLQSLTAPASNPPSSGTHAAPASGPAPMNDGTTGTTSENPQTIRAEAVKPVEFDFRRPILLPPLAPRDMNGNQVSRATLNKRAAFLRSQSFA